MAQRLLQMLDMWHDTQYEKLQGLRQETLLLCVSLLLYIIISILPTMDIVYDFWYSVCVVMKDYFQCVKYTLAPWTVCSNLSVWPVRLYGSTACSGHAVWYHISTLQRLQYNCLIPIEREMEKENWSSIVKQLFTDNMMWRFKRSGILCDGNLTLLDIQYTEQTFWMLKM